MYKAADFWDFVLLVPVVVALIHHLEIETVIFHRHRKIKNKIYFKFCFEIFWQEAIFQFYLKKIVPVLLRSYTILRSKQS